MDHDSAEPFRVDEPAGEIGSLELLMYPGIEPWTGVGADRPLYLVLVHGGLCTCDGEAMLRPVSEAE